MFVIIFAAFQAVTPVPAGVLEETVTIKVSGLPSFGLFAFSPNGRTLASITGGELRLIDLTTGKEGPVLLTSVQASQFRVTGDGKRILALGPRTAYYGLDGTLPKYTLNVPFTESLPVLKPDGTPDFTKPPRRVGHGTATPAVSPDGKTLYAHNFKRDIVAYSLPDLKEVKEYPGVYSPVTAIHPSPDGKFLVVWTDDEVLGFDVESGKRLWRKETPDIGFGGAFIPGTTRMLCYGQRLNAREGVLGFQSLDAETGRTQPRRKLPEAIEYPYVPLLLPLADGKHALIPNPKLPAIHVFDAATGAEVGTYRVPRIPRLLTLSPDGKRLVVCDDTKTIQLVPVVELLRAPLLTADELQQGYGFRRACRHIRLRGNG